MRADERTADQSARAQAEEHQAEARRELIGAARDHDIAEHQIGGEARRGGEEEAEIGVAGERGAGEAGRGADQHHALEAEIDDAGAFADQFAERRVEQRGPRDDRRRDHGEGERRVHRRAPPVRRRPSTMNNTAAIKRLMTA